MTAAYGPPPHGDPAPGADGLSDEERTWALASHIGALVTAWFAFGFLAPLFVMLVKDGSPFVRRHAVESLNFQISMLIYAVVGAVLGFLLAVMTFGLGLVVVIPIALLVAMAALGLVIVATYRASNGEEFRYPFTIRIVR